MPPAGPSDRDTAPAATAPLTPEDLTLITARHQASQPGFAALLWCYRRDGRFPRDGETLAVPENALLSHILGQPVPPDAASTLPERTAKRFHAEIREHCKARGTTNEDIDVLADWLIAQPAVRTSDPATLALAVCEECRRRGLEPPSTERVDRLVRLVLHTHEMIVADAVLARLDPVTRQQLDALLQPATPTSEQSREQPAPAVLAWLRGDPGRPGVASVTETLDKLRHLRAITLPEDLLQDIPPKQLNRWRDRVTAEAPFELRRHGEAARLTWLAAYVQSRTRSLTDDLVEVLLETIHTLAARAERKVERELIADLKRVTGKPSLLYSIAGAAVARPDGTVREVVFPVAGEQTLQDLVKEGNATGPTYSITLRTRIRSAYRSHYRRMVPPLLETLEFRSNNALHQPVITALALIRRYAHSRQVWFPPDETVPMDGIVRGLWRDAILEEVPRGDDETGCPPRINRITYEICVLQALRERIRCKEIWVVGAERYRNPDEDVPADFDQLRATYYSVLGLPAAANDFIALLQREMHEALQTFDRGLANNAHVRISRAQGGRIIVTPLDPQPEPPNLTVLKAEIGRTWPMTRLLDIVQETDRRLAFTDSLRSPTAYETLGRDQLRPRLLLCLHGLGTNAGLARMASGDSDITVKDLTYVRQRFIHVDGLRPAIATVTNGTLRARTPGLWGEVTTACASDSKHFGAWDQNLITQWHVRYGGRGVMIYWHVERKSLCIHSQLKAPSSSEVASMMEGVLRHCTEMAIDRQYVDSHGQSEVAFAFCRLLGFQLLPRLKAINRQRLYRPLAGQGDAYPALAPVMTRAIDWTFVAQQYDEMIKFATALRLGTAETEIILRRFTRSNLQHPTYRALAELGKAVKTIFLCRYLHLLELRREINEGLNVIENWNGANNFVFFARRGDMTSNRRDHHQQSMLALHLLQNCMIYINTLMIQKILQQSHWHNRLTKTDLRALSPLFWDHINPYGRYDIDPNVRFALD